MDWGSLEKETVSWCFLTSGMNDSTSWLMNSAMSFSLTLSSMLSDSTLRKSSTCWTILVSLRALADIISVMFLSFSVLGSRLSADARMMLRGVRNSWEMLVKNCSLAWLISSAFCWLRVSSSSWRSIFILDEADSTSHRMMPEASSTYRVMAHQESQGLPGIFLSMRQMSLSAVWPER